MITIQPNWPARIQALLSQFDLERAVMERTGFVVSNPARDDHNPSLRITISPENGRILLIDRAAGTTTLDVLDSLGMTWADLYPADDAEEMELIQFSHDLSGGATDQSGISEDDDYIFDTRHKIYSHLLSLLTIGDSHTEDLKRRGFSRAQIERNEYRTLKLIQFAKLADAIQKAIRSGVNIAPGFVPVSSDKVKIVSRSGLLIPVRDLKGRIRSLKVRGDTIPRYSWFGEGNVAFAHWPLQSAPGPAVIVTEGELKADLACEVLDKPVFAVPGMTNWRTALPFLRALKARVVTLAFDKSSDPAKQREIERYADEMADHLEYLGMEVRELEWDAIQD